MATAWLDYLRQFSALVKVYFAVVVICAIVLIGLNWANIFVVPVVYGTPALLIWLVFYNRLRLGEFSQDELFWRMFAAGSTSGAIVALLIELVLTFVFGVATFGVVYWQNAEEIAEKTAEDPYWTPADDEGNVSYKFAYVAFVFLSAYAVAALVEECVKAMLVRNTCCGRPAESSWCVQRPDPRPKQHAFTTVSLMLATSLGFSFAENLMYVFSQGSASVGLNDDLGFKLLLALARGLLATPVHAICACYTGLRLAVRDVQRRRRDAALLSQATAAGVPQFMVLPSGVSVPIAPSDMSGSGTAFPAGTTFAAMPSSSPGYLQPAQAATDSHVALMGTGGPVQAVPVTSLIQALYSPPLAGGQTNGTLQAAAVQGAAQTGATAPSVPAQPAIDPALMKVWSWPRVLWPAVIIHGTYDFVALLLASMGNQGLATFLTFLFAAIIVSSALWALSSQFKHSFELISEGQMPELLTCAPMWWPQWMRACLGRCGIAVPERGWPMGSMGAAYSAALGPTQSRPPGPVAPAVSPARTAAVPTGPEGLDYVPVALAAYAPPARDAPSTAAETDSDSAPLVTRAV